MKKVLLIISLLAYGWVFGQGNSKYVNPFIGTDRMGHTFPGATLPFGFVQLSPDTDTIPYNEGNTYNPLVYQYCAGYQYNDPTIVGFSHTHFNGTGHSDLGDFLLMPVSGEVKINPGIASQPRSGYRSRYDKNSEKAEAGYYRVYLTDYDINVELTATQRTGVHRYTFHRTDSCYLLLDMMHGIYNYDGKVVWSSLRVINDTLVVGYRQTNGWARDRFIYFAMTFSKPIQEYYLLNLDKETYTGFWRRWNMDHNFPERSGKKLKAIFNFDMRSGDQLVVKMGISGVSEQGALKNLLAEAVPFNFDEIRYQATQSWDAELDRVQIVASDEEKIVFYTALYHALLSPNIYQDIDARYRGLDHEIHTAIGFTNYTVFSLWDTFRALHPFLLLYHPLQANDMILSMLAHANQSVHGMLPVWSHHANENWCMTGYHALSVIADAWVKGIRGFPPDEALKAMLQTATYKSYDGLDEYMQLGYVASETSSTSVSTTLEYAYDDWTLSQMALTIGKDSLAKIFKNRSLNYRNVFDYETGMMRPKKRNGHFVKPFDPLSTHNQGFIEGNAWTYSLFVPHDIEGLMQLMGGADKLEAYLDTLFTMVLPEKYYENTEDISKDGVMGNYIHGNEPGHHIPYLYNYTAHPWKTGLKVEKILKTFYRNSPSGLCGNDDCGQMSAWYIFSSLGFYPICPGSTEYALGKPAFKEINLRLENGSNIHIVTRNFHADKPYVQQVLLNGKPLSTPFIHHSDLKDGAQLEFIMGKSPKI